MNCPLEHGTSRETPELLIDYCAGSLAAEQAANFERHLAGCAACTEFVEGQQAVWRALDDWDAPPAPMGFDRELYRRIAEREKRAWWLRVPVLPFAAAACLMLVASFALMNRAPVVEVEWQPAVAQETVEVEATLDDLEMLKQLDLVKSREL